METNRIILSYCKNFDKIINTDFLEDDTLSLQLVKIYKDFIFKIDINNELDVAKVKELDKTMCKYVDDYFFRKTLQKEILTIKVKKSAGDVIRTIVDSIISIFKKYEEDSTRKIYISRWI
ncbi:MAG: hypothetical protein E7163_01135 [Firmicutes bacterium]|nr:hypothetical protein [Bacillota bacterium]